MVMNGMVRTSGTSRNDAAPLSKRLVASAIVISLGLLAQACSAAPPATVAGPSNPNSPAPKTTYRPVIGDYSANRPVEPTPWIEQNQRVAPAPRP